MLIGSIKISKNLLLIFFLLLLYPYISLAADLGEIYNAIKTAGQAAALLAMIWGGVRYLLSIGNPGLAAEARAWLIAGFTGLLIVTSASFLYEKVTGRAISWKIEGEIEKVEVPPLPEEPGVFYYSSPNCSTVTVGGGEQVKSIKILNDKDKEFVVVIKDINNKCKIYSGNGCHNLGDLRPTSIHPYLLDPEAKGSINLWRRPYFSGGKYKLKNIQKITEYNLSNLPIKDPPCHFLYQRGLSCLGSIQFTSSYTIILYNQEDECEVYECKIVKGKLEGAESNIKIHGLFSQSLPYRLTVIPKK